MLKRVSIQNFKSLKDVTLDLQKVNLLIGPNNSGKTNFLKAFKCLSECVEDVRAFSKDDHYQRDNFNELNIHLTYHNAEDKHKENHVFLGWVEDVDDEKGGGYYSVYTSYYDDVESDAFGDYAEDANREEFEKLCGTFDIFKIDSNKLDKPAPVGEGSIVLNGDASNMIAFFDRMRDEYHDVFAQIRTDLSKCVPEFTEINFQSVKPNEKLIKEFGDKTFKRIGLTDGRQKTIYWADELSEGTLYFIALLCIINQPNPPKLLLLEEPEKGIHPRRIHEVIQFIFALAEDKGVQIIMTTHSPTVVDMFKDMPESVFIFDKDDEGATHVKNLQTDIIEPETEESKKIGIDPPHYTSSLGNAWTVGFLGGVPK